MRRNDTPGSWRIFSLPHRFPRKFGSLALSMGMASPAITVDEVSEGDRARYSPADCGRSLRVGRGWTPLWPCLHRCRRDEQRSACQPEPQRTVVRAAKNAIDEVVNSQPDAADRPFTGLRVPETTG